MNHNSKSPEATISKTTMNLRTGKIKGSSGRVCELSTFREQVAQYRSPDWLIAPHWAHLFMLVNFTAKWRCRPKIVLHPRNIGDSKLCITPISNIHRNLVSWRTFTIDSVMPLQSKICVWAVARNNWKHSAHLPDVSCRGCKPNWMSFSSRVSREIPSQLMVSTKRKACNIPSARDWDLPEQWFLCHAMRV